jgi:hypothetical protein
MKKSKMINNLLNIFNKYKKIYKHFLFINFVKDSNSNLI